MLDLKRAFDKELMFQLTDFVQFIYIICPRVIIQFAVKFKIRIGKVFKLLGRFIKS